MTRENNGKLPRISHKEGKSWNFHSVILFLKKKVKSVFAFFKKRKKNLNYFFFNNLQNISLKHHKYKRNLI